MFKNDPAIENILISGKSESNPDGCSERKKKFTSFLWVYFNYVEQN